MRPLADSDVSISSLQLPSDADVVKAAGTHLYIITAGCRKGGDHLASTAQSKKIITTAFRVA
jgi:hypothetical protein